VNQRTSAGRIKSPWWAAVLAAGVVISGCSGAPEGRPAEGEPQGSSSSSPALRDDELLYLHGTRLHRMDIASGDRTRVVRLPGPDVVASRSTQWIAFVEGSAVGADDFLESPVLYLRDLATGDEINVGPGFAPMWNPLDDRVAFLRPIEPRDCEVESCAGAATVALVRPGGEVQQLLPAGRWGLLAWAGDVVLVADGSDLDHTTVVGPGIRAQLDVPPSEIWDASPNGRWLVTVGSDGAEVVRMESGRIDGSGVEIDIGGATLGDGSWALDSSRLAATVGSGAAAHVVVIAPDRPTARPVRGSARAAGSVLWSPTGTALTITRSASGGRLEAAYCAVDGRSSCRGLFSWVQDVALLRME
jgi:hypothetical protein